MFPIVLRALFKFTLLTYHQKAENESAFHFFWAPCKDSSSYSLSNSQFVNNKDRYLLK